MARDDNFRRHSRPGRSGHAIDGIVPQDSFKRSGSIGINKSDKDSRVASGQIGDFNRPEGYHPGAQPMINIASKTRPPEAISNRPRRSPLATDEPDAKPKRRKKQHSRRYKVIKRSILSVVALFVLMGGFLGWKVLHNTSKIFGGGGVFGFLNSTKLKGEDQGRVNILLAGTSEDDPGHGGAMLTDSIMIISIDTTNNNAFMMSIPRDLWVKYGTNECSLGTEGKINAVYECGEEVKFKQNGYPDGGMGLLEKDIKDDFGLDINYYAKIDYTAFRDAVNAVGGIDVTIKTNDPRGLYDGNISRIDGGPLKLANGVQHLDGQTALNLARARCDSVCYGFTRGDFDRTDHQRMMLLALKDKGLSVGVLSNPTKISSLLDAAGNNVKTDFKTNEARRLYDIIKKISNASIKSIGLADQDVSLVTTTTINNLSAVRPVAGIYDFSQIIAFIKKITSHDPVVKEGATVVVLNASDTAGLAQRKANVLTAKGLTIKAIGNDSRTRASTVVVALNAQKTATKAYLEQLYKTTATTDTTANPEANNYQADFVIILGQNEATTQ
jgi:LCP family protein required for cell wall assembly